MRRKICPAQNKKKKMKQSFDISFYSIAQVVFSRNAAVCGDLFSVECLSLVFVK